MCKTCPGNDRKKGAVIVRLGMTVVELMMVIAILGILTSIAVSAYSSYRVSEYDNEAIATLNDLYAQATKYVAEWGVGGTDGIPIGCIGPASCNAKAGKSVAESCEQATAFNIDKSGIVLPAGVHHWRYQLCFGYVDNTNKVEGFLVSAHRLAGSNDAQRVILYGTGIETPIIVENMNGNTLNKFVPEGAQLTHDKWDNDFLNAPI